MKTQSSNGQSWCYLLRLLLAASVLCAVPRAAVADDGIVGAIVNSVVEAAKAERRKKAYEAWRRQEGQVIACLRQRYGIEPNTLIQRGIGPDDKRVRPYISACQEEIRQARARAAEAQRQRDAAAAAEAERKRLAALEAEREAKRQADADAARVAAARQARIKDLKSRFPAAWVPKIMAGEIELGWTREAVREALGPPRSIVRTPDGSEMWSYVSLRVVFTNGKVTYFGAVGGPRPASSGSTMNEPSPSPRRDLPPKQPPYDQSYCSNLIANAQAMYGQRWERALREVAPREATGCEAQIKQARSKEAGQQRSQEGNATPSAVAAPRRMSPNEIADHCRKLVLVAKGKFGDAWYANIDRVHYPECVPYIEAQPR